MSPSTPLPEPPAEWQTLIAEVETQRRRAERLREELKSEQVLAGADERARLSVRIGELDEEIRKLQTRLDELHRQGPPPPPEAPFFVPFPRNEHFQGREQDLVDLHAKLAGSGAVGIRPAGLTGMGGIGKTQLAVEYVYRYRQNYPGGVFWINAAEDWIAGSQGFAALGLRLQPALSERSRAEQVEALVSHLRRHPDSLLVLDNVADPAELDRPLGPDFIPGRLPCPTLFTTRQRYLGRFRPVEVTVLPEAPALKLLLRHPDRRAILDRGHPEHETARRICMTLGYLPLALEIAAAHLGRFRQALLQKYLDDLLARGALAVLDDGRGGVRETDLGTRHAAAVAATLAGQWDALVNPDARLLLRVAGQLPEAAQLPRARLGLLAGVEDEDGGFFGTALDAALRELDEASLVEELQAEELRLHPLVREFAARQTPPAEAPAFRATCALRLIESYQDTGVLERQILRRGVVGPEQDLLAALARESQTQEPPEDGSAFGQGEALLRLVQRESHALSCTSSAVVIQTQIYKRALESGLTAVAASAQSCLTALHQPYLRLRWHAGRKSPELERTLSGHGNWVRAVAVTPDGRRAISASDDRTLKVWNLESGQEERTLRGHGSGVLAVAVTPDGRRAISASDDRTLKVWNLESGQEERTLRGHGYAVNAVAVTPDGRRAISASDDGTLKIWSILIALNEDLESSQEERTLNGHGYAVRAVAVAPDGRRIISGSDDSKLRVWNLENGQEERTLSVYGTLVLAVAVTPDGRRVISTSNESTLKVWSISTLLSADPESGQQERTPIWHSDWIRAVAVTPDGRRAISASDDGTLKVWNVSISLSANLDSVQLEGILSGHGDWIRAVAVTPDGRRAISASDDGMLKVWNLDSIQEELTFSTHGSRVNAVAVTPDGQRVVSALSDWTLKVWNLENGQEERTLIGHGDWVLAVAVTPDGRRAISASSDHTLKVWRLESGQEERTLSGHNSVVLAVAVTPDGRRAISASDDRTLKVWNLESWQEERTLSGHGEGVLAVAVTPDGRRVISASSDTTLRVWDITTGSELATIHLDAALFCVAVAPDGVTIVTGDSAGSVYCLDYVEPAAA